MIRKRKTDIWIPRILRRIPEVVVGFRKFVGNYVHYRKQKNCHSVAWKKARNTI